MESREHLLAWLKDAYSMEKALVPILENHAEDAEGSPEIQERIRQHVAETERHAEMVERCIRRYGEEPSTMKNMLGGMFGSMQSVATGMFEDESLKNGLLDYATENFEIACYTALAVAAETCGDSETASVCRDILKDEMDMANFLSSNLPSIVRKTLHMHTSE